MLLDLKTATLKTRITSYNVCYTKLLREIPGIPNFEKEILDLAFELDKISVKFLNINELEYSETNYQSLIDKGFSEKDDIV